MRPVALGLLLAGLLLAARGAILAEYLLEHPYARVLFSDAWVYWFEAGRKAAGDWLPQTPFLSAPLYPFVLGGLRTVGLSLGGVLTLQTLLGIGCVLLLYDAVRLRFDRPTALLAAVLLALTGDAAYASLRIMPEILHLALVCLLLRLWTVEDALPAVSTGRAMLRLVASGLTLGFLMLAWPPAQLLLPVLVVWAVITRRPPGVRVARAALAAVLPLLIISPATLHNYQAEGTLIAVSANGGINLLQGNNPRALGLLTPLPGIRTTREHMFDDAARRFLNETGRRGTWAEIDAHFGAKARDYLLDNPLRAVELGLTKLAWFTASRDFDNLGSRRLEKEFGLYPLAWLTPLNPTWLMGLALAGTSLLLARWRHHLPEIALLLVPVAVCVVFHYSARYRVPAIPLLALTSAVALTHWRALPLRPALRWACALLPLPVAALAAISGFTSVAPMRADTATRVAHAYMEWGDLEAIESEWASALTRYAAAQAADPGYLAPYVHAYQAAVKAGDATAARAWVARARMEFPERAIGYQLAYNLAAKRGDATAAVAALADARQAGVSDPEITRTLIWTLATAPGLTDADRATARRIARGAVPDAVPGERALALATRAVAEYAAGDASAAAATLVSARGSATADPRVLGLIDALNRTMASGNPLPSALAPFPLQPPPWERPTDHPMIKADPP